MRQRKIKLITTLTKAREILNALKIDIEGGYGKGYQCVMKNQDPLTFDREYLKMQWKEKEEKNGQLWFSDHSFFLHIAEEHNKLCKDDLYWLRERHLQRNTDAYWQYPDDKNHQSNLDIFFNKHSKNERHVRYNNNPYYGGTSGKILDVIRSQSTFYADEPLLTKDFIIKMNEKLKLYAAFN